MNQNDYGSSDMPGIIDVVGYDDDDYFSTLPERVKQELSQYRTEVSDSSELRRLAGKKSCCAIKRIKRQIIRINGKGRLSPLEQINMGRKRPFHFFISYDMMFSSKGIGGINYETYRYSEKINVSTRKRRSGISRNGV